MSVQILKGSVQWDKREEDAEWGVVGLHHHFSPFEHAASCKKVFPFPLYTAKLNKEQVHLSYNAHCLLAHQIT